MNELTIKERRKKKSSIRWLKMPLSRQRLEKCWRTKHNRRNILYSFFSTVEFTCVDMDKHIHHLQTYRAWEEMKVYIYVNVKQGIKRKYLLLRRSNSKNIFICVCAVGECRWTLYRYMCVRCNNRIRMVHEGRTGDCSSLWRYYLTQHVSNDSMESCKNGLKEKKKTK